MKLNLIASKEVRRDRLAICEACPVFVSSTRSCGTLVKDAIVKKHVTLNGVTFNPCGCQMDTKVTFTTSHCPAGKWSGKLSLAQKVELKSYLEKAGTTFNVTELFKWADMATGIKNQRTTCPPCVETVRNDLWNMVKDIEKELPLVKEPRKRGPKTIAS